MDRNYETTTNASAQGRKIRVCPYCENRIPASEDPCHHCGHLEPAEVTPHNKKEDLRLHSVVLLLSVVMLAFPGVENPNAYICEPDGILGCLVNNAWSVPMGILLATCSLLNITWGLITNTQVDHLEKNKHQSEHQASHGKNKVAAQ